MSATRRVGDLSLAMVIAAMLARGLKVALPYSDASRYDLIADDGATLQRVQVKTGRLTRGGSVVCFKASSSVAHHFYKGKPGKKHRDYVGQIDAFAVYCPALRRVFLLPIEMVRAKSQVYLRVMPAKNGNTRLVNLASDFEYYQF